ncbi:MAG TPA: chromate efflux transporter [Bacteroidota bacterium]|nr:chromate efflux transporter [Bacteroidota bacterium]
MDHEITDQKDEKPARVLRELASLFFRLGVTSFGGPAAHIAMMEEDVVKRRQWLTHEHFLDLLGATNIIPGPNSTEMAIHVGYVKGGWKGLIVAGVSFLLPAVAISLLIAHFYVVYGSLPEVGRFMWGIRSGIIAVILAAVYRLGKPIVVKKFSLVIGIAVFILNLFRVGEITLLIGAGCIGLLWGSRSKWTSVPLPMLLSIFLPVGITAIGIRDAATVSDIPTITSLGLFFLKIGSILYGSGYVLVAFLQGGLVDTHHWLSQSQLLDAIAVGQFTPGPVLSTSTFIGYVILGVPGAMISTACIFFPSFVFVLIIGQFIPKMRKSALSAGFLDGVNAASLGLMLAVCVVLGRSTLSGPATWLIFIASAIAIVRWNLHAGWIVGGAAVLGWVFSLFGLIS